MKRFLKTYKAHIQQVHLKILWGWNWIEILQHAFSFYKDQSKFKDSETFLKMIETLWQIRFHLARQIQPIGSCFMKPCIPDQISDVCHSLGRRNEIVTIVNKLVLLWASGHLGILLSILEVHLAVYGLYSHWRCALALTVFFLISCWYFKMGDFIFVKDWSFPLKMEISSNFRPIFPNGNCHLFLSSGCFL